MIVPKLLTKGDKIGLVAPSRTITSDQISDALELFKKWGLTVLQGESLLGRHGYFAGTDDQRKIDIQTFINDPEVKAIFCARGGYGMTRIIDEIDIQPLINNPKWIIGFSDITALHIKLNQIDITSIHGLMPAQFGKEGVSQSIKSLQKLLFQGIGEINAKPHEYNHVGSTRAPLVGGNLSLVAECLGTKSEINTEGKILLLEEIDEYLYKIDRMLNQLKRAGKLSNLAGLVIGDFSDMNDTQIPFGKDITNLINDFVKDYDYPRAFNFPIGHENLNLAVPLGFPVSLSVKQDQSTIKFDLV